MSKFTPLREGVLPTPEQIARVLQMPVEEVVAVAYGGAWPICCAHTHRGKGEPELAKWVDACVDAWGRTGNWQDWLKRIEKQGYELVRKASA